MLRITVERQATETLLILEGRLTGPWVEELHRELNTLWSESNPPDIEINLTEVLGMDAAGRALLTDAHARGAELTGSGLTARAFIEEIAGPDHVAQTVTSAEFS